ncbi:hypothetical protein [Streptomyces sp. NBC_00691]|uniref:hypothetical protein n=1 Tax=Streptomyces sp. NBC_00691 TaxID=2903671 RepID=UPI002E31E269|nr:hypothetical protein [Streptomyces sp. NBC_00691]
MTLLLADDLDVIAPGLDGLDLTMLLGMPSAMTASVSGDENPHVPEVHAVGEEDEEEEVLGDGEDEGDDGEPGEGEEDDDDA